MALQSRRSTRSCPFRDAKADNEPSHPLARNLANLSAPQTHVQSSRLGKNSGVMSLENGQHLTRVL